jgi:Na+/melibiose symporter-like transporter
MELDELKQRWNNADQQYQGAAYDLNKILNAKAEGPLDSLRKAYKRQLILLPLTAAFLTFSCLSHETLNYNALIWSAVLMMLILIVGYYRNYKLVQFMQQPAENGIKQKLEEDLQVLYKNVKQELILYRVFFVVFIIALEVTMFYNLVPAYNKWHEVMLPVRLAVYMVALVGQPYMTRYFFKQNYGRYISRLQELVDQAS